MNQFKLKDPHGGKKYYPLVMVEWKDARMDNGWQTGGQAAAAPLASCVSVGLLITKNKDRIVLASGMCLFPNQEITDTLTIPNTWQVKIIPLGVIE